ncbi:MAG: ribonuclease P, partial [Thermoprotei archaeon]
MRGLRPRRRRRREALIMKDIALQRVKRLFQLAEEAFRENPSLSNRYVELARLIAMRSRIRIPRELRRRFCHKCGCYLQPG